MATVKNVGLSPLNMGDVKKYTAMQSPSYKEEFWKKMSDTNDIDYYLYALNEADKKGLKIEDIDFSNLDSIDDQWSAFYTQALADDTTKTDYGTVIEGEEPWGELTEKQYLTKLLDKKREYNIWLKEEAEIAAQKEAMSGWDKFWNGVGAWGTELLHSLEQIPLSLADFVTNWDGGDSVGFIEDWRQDLMNRQRELANYERSYTDLRAVDGDWDPTFMGQLVMGSAQTLGLMIPSMITNFVIPGSGFWVMYSNVFLENVYEARHDPNVNASQIEIILRGALMAGAEAYIEWALGSSMLDDLVLNGKKFSKELVNVTTKEGLKILGKDIIHEACEEALQELSGYMVNMVLSLANPTWEQTMSDDLAKDIGMAALMGGIFAAANIVNSTVIQDIANGRVVRNITRKFTAGDIISDYKVDKKTNKVKEGFHATNFFERIALNANFSTFKNNLDLAKEGKLSSEEKNFLYNQAMALGEIFNRSNPSQIKRSMELLNKLQEYVKQEGVKEETLKKADEAYLSSLLINIKAVQSTAATEYWKSKISNKEAAKLAKDAKITKTEKVIDKKNVEEVTKTIDNNTKDPKKKARKKVVKTLIDEGKTIATTDGEKLEVIGDVIFVPDNYLNDGDPNFIVRNSIEKDLAQEFVAYMKSPKRLVGWTQAKAALIKVYPEMAEYTDQHIARNLLFNPGGAYALVAALPNSEFNLLFLNMLEGLKQVVYKTEVAKTVKTLVISNIENNFRYAARMFCANNYGVNPHDLHNVLTKADQIFIKNERAKIEAEANEWARANKSLVEGLAPNQYFYDLNSKESPNRNVKILNLDYEDISGAKNLSYEEYVDLFDVNDPEYLKILEKEFKGSSKFNVFKLEDTSSYKSHLTRDTILYRGLEFDNTWLKEKGNWEFYKQFLSCKPGDVLDLSFRNEGGWGIDGKRDNKNRTNVPHSADAKISELFTHSWENFKEFEEYSKYPNFRPIMIRGIYPKGEAIGLNITGNYPLLTPENRVKITKRMAEGAYINSVEELEELGIKVPKNKVKTIKEDIETGLTYGDFFGDIEDGLVTSEWEIQPLSSTKGRVLDHSFIQGVNGNIIDLITLDFRKNSKAPLTPMDLNLDKVNSLEEKNYLIKKAYENAQKGGEAFYLYSGNHQEQGDINFNKLWESLFTLKKGDYIIPKDLWLQDSWINNPSITQGYAGERKIVWKIKVGKEAPNYSYLADGISSIKLDEVPLKVESVDFGFNPDINPETLLEEKRSRAEGDKLYETFNFLQKKMRGLFTEKELEAMENPPYLAKENGERAWTEAKARESHNTIWGFNPETKNYEAIKVLSSEEIKDLYSTNNIDESYKKGSAKYKNQGVEEKISKYKEKEYLKWLKSKGINLNTLSPEPYFFATKDKSKALIGDVDGIYYNNHLWFFNPKTKNHELVKVFSQEEFGDKDPYYSSSDPDIQNQYLSWLKSKGINLDGEVEKVKRDFDIKHDLRVSSEFVVVIEASLGGENYYYEKGIEEGKTLGFSKVSRREELNTINPENVRTETSDPEILNQHLFRGISKNSPDHSHYFYYYSTDPEVASSYQGKEGRLTEKDVHFKPGELEVIDFDGDYFEWNEDTFFEEAKEGEKGKRVFEVKVYDGEKYDTIRLKLRSNVKDNKPLIKVTKALYEGYGKMMEIQYKRGLKGKLNLLKKPPYKLKITPEFITELKPLLDFFNLPYTEEAVLYLRYLYKANQEEEPRTELYVLRYKLDYPDLKGIVFKNIRDGANEKIAEKTNTVYVLYNEETNSSEIREELNGINTEVEGAAFTTPEYENETYKYMQSTLLKENIPELEKSNLTIKDIIKDPESYLRPEIIDYIIKNFEDLSQDSVYMGLRSYIIGETDGRKTITVSENGDRYYFADVTPIKKFNSDSITMEVNNNPTGTSLFEKYSGKTVKASEFWRGEALIGKAKNVEIEFREGGGNFYSDDKNKIHIDTNSFLKTNQDVLFALNHEFQHALQSTNRTARGFTLGAKLPQELVEEVKEMFPEAFKEGMSHDQEVKVANRIIYKYSGEMEANLHAIDEEYYPFIIAIKDDHYVILSPKGTKPYEVPFVRTNKMDEKEDVDIHVKEKIRQLKRNPDKNLIETTNLKYFKRKGKKLRLDPDLQTFIIEATNLDQMEEWLSSRIKDGTLRKRKLMKWFKETPNINEYTFKHLREAFWPNSTILTFEDLQKASITLTMEIDEKGNPVLVPFVFNGKRVGEKPKEVVYKYGKDRFSINENSYRVALMEYWTGYADVNKVRRIVGATEILRRTETFTSVEEKAKNSSKDGDIDLVLGVTEDFADAVLNDMPRSKKAQKLREIVVKSIAAKSIAGDYTYEEALKMLNKYTIEYFEDLPDEELDNLYVTEMMKKDGLNVNKEIIKKAITRNRKNAIANMKRLATTIWNNTTVKNRKRLPSDIQNMFTEEGKLKPEVYKGRPISEVSSSEELLKETALKARRGDYASSEIEKAYASVDKARKQIEKLKKKSKTQVKSTTKVVTEYKTDIKTEAKVITVQTTKKETPKKLEKLLGTNFTKKRMSNMQEMSNYEYFVSEKEVFREENQEVLDSITEAEWIEIVEWFEQSEIVGTEGELGTFKAIRMFILADLVSRIKTHNIVLDNTWLNRANNIMSSNVHSSAVELATWGKVLNSINPYRQLAEQYNVSEETLDDIQDALETDNDEELAKAIDELRLEIAENYVEKNMMEKIMAFRYTAMLSGPVTWLRNLISNYIVKYFNKAAASIGDKLGGKRLSTYQGYKLVGTKVRRDVAEFIKVNLLDTGLLHQLTEGYSKYDPYTAETANKIDKDYIVRTMVNNFAKKFEQDHAYGDGKAAQVFNKFSAFVRKMISDDKFVNEATLRYFGKMLTEDIESGRMDANKLKEGIFNKEIVSKFAEAQWLAMGDYMKNTNFMTKAISALNESKWARYIMPLIMPFAQSSWNWWVETMRYSPFGLVQSVVQLLKYEKYVGEMDRKRESSRKGQSASVQGAMLDKYMTLRNLGKGAIGTSLWTLGIILGAAGVVGLQKNKDDKYVIKIGPIEINVDNIFGSSTFLAGAALVTAIKDGKWLEMFNVTIDQMARTLFVTDLISSFKFQSIGDYVAELPLNVLYSFIPNFIKMISQNVQIYNVKYDKGILGDLERMASGIIPGLSYAFPKEIDPFTGKPRFHRIPILTQAGGISYNDISEAERAAIAVGVGAGQLTGELTVNGEKYQLDREKVNVYRGEITNQYMTDLLNDQYIYEGKRYSQMDRKERAKAIKSILNKSAEYAKIKMWTEMGNKYYTSKDLYVTLKNLGINNVYQGSGGYIKK